MIKPKIQKLKNGLRLLTIPMPESSSVTVAVFVRAGSAYETQKNSGISHFLEHMCFKGTEKYPRPIDISIELEQIGAAHNAFTSRDLTGYYAKTAPRYFQRAFNVVSDLYLHPHIDEQEMEKEKGVIIEEIHMYDDDPRSKVSEVLEQGLYGNQPAGWNIAGTPQHITQTTRDMFVQYRNARYTPQNTIVVVAGAFNTQEVTRAVRETFGVMRKPEKNPIAQALKIKEKGNQISIIERTLDQTHFAMGFYGIPVNSTKRFQVSMVTKILGGSMSSRLFQRVREELGAAYYVGSSNNMYATHGFLDIYAGTNHKKTEEAIRAIMQEIAHLKEGGITKEELRRAQDYSIGTFLLSLESSSDLGFYYGQQEVLTGKIESPQQVIKRLKEVTVEQVTSAAREFLTIDTMRFSIIGPYKNSSGNKFKKLLSS
ncbi:MAG: pitrilysin family protein [Candidatus Paceibacterota bacterium]